MRVRERTGDTVVVIGAGMGGISAAILLAAQGLKVGLLDADIYGPSLPQMLGTREKPQASGQRIMPLEEAIAMLTAEAVPPDLRPG